MGGGTLPIPQLIFIMQLRICKIYVNLKHCVGQKSNVIKVTHTRSILFKKLISQEISVSIGLRGDMFIIHITEKCIPLIWSLINVRYLFWTLPYTLEDPVVVEQHHHVESERWSLWFPSHDRLSIFSRQLICYWQDPIFNLFPSSRQHHNGLEFFSDV